MEPNLKLAGRLNTIAWIISGLVLLLILLMRPLRVETEMDFSFLPAVYSTLNAVTALVLLFALYSIKNKKVAAHRKAMYIAILSSFLFLLGYVVYHFTTPETKFGGEGAIRFIYFFLLTTHILLAAVVFPFILFTFIKAYTNQFEQHRKMARWVFPVWLYVAVTGPVLYFMLRPYF